MTGEMGGGTITVVMAVRDGAAHLPAQLASLAAQSDADWRLWVFDDGSRDASRAILADFAGRVPQQVRLLDGPRLGGAAGNFLAALGHPDLPEGLTALSDQDDLWYRDKLARARAAVMQDGSGGPVLYGAEADLIDAQGRRIGQTRPPRRGPGFGNALVQNAVAGHSVMLDAAALRLLRAPGGGAGQADIPHHDWWLYQIVSGAGGRVILDAARVLGYRQHGRNAMGMGMAAKARRLWGGEWAAWTDAHLAALARAGPLLTPAHRAQCAAFAAARTAPGPLARIRGLAAAGVWRQSRSGTALITALAALGRL